MSVYQLKDEMNKAGYTDVATSVGIRTLTKGKLLETFMYDDQWNNGQEYLACRLTKNGEQWILDNQDKLEFKIKQKEIDHNDKSEDLPF